MISTVNQLNRQPSAFAAVAECLADIGRQFYLRGWALGTSGNFSAVVDREPLRLAITATALDKGLLRGEQFLEIDAEATVMRGEGRPSAETLLHLAIVKLRDAGAVLHTHSVWSNVLTQWHADDSGVSIEGYEMLKGLDGVTTHEYREWLPILQNSQDMVSLSNQVAAKLQQTPKVHGFLLQQHGLYTWGKTLAEAKRHVEILEFLMETLVRARSRS